MQAFSTFLALTMSTYRGGASKSIISNFFEDQTSERLTEKRRRTLARLPRSGSVLAEWASCRKGTAKLSNTTSHPPALSTHDCSTHILWRCLLHLSVYEPKRQSNTDNYLSTRVISTDTRPSSLYTRQLEHIPLQWPSQPPQLALPMCVYRF